MATDSLTFTRWLQDSVVADDHLTDPQRAVLQAGFRFLQHSGNDYFSRRLLSHVLLHAQTGLKVAPLARLLGFSRSAASAQQGLSAKEVVQAAHHRLAGRTQGKLLPRFAGPIAQFLCAQPQASRWDLLDFIRRTWGVTVSRMALYRFLKKYGLDEASRIVPLPIPPVAEAAPPTAPPPSADPPPVGAPPCPEPAPLAESARLEPLAIVVRSAAPPGHVPLPPRDFFLPPPSTPGPSCSCPKPATGWTRPATASLMTTVPCSAAC